MTLEEVGEECSRHMNEIAMMFKGDPKLTLIVRHPGKPDRDLMMSNDSFEEIRAVVDRREAAG